MALGTYVGPQTAPVERSRNLRSWAIFAVTNTIAVVCLIQALRGADLGRIWGETRQMHWRWVLAAVCFDVCVYVLHAWRWSLVLRPVRLVKFTHCLEAIYVGLFANEILPARAGELIRCFLLSRSSTIPISVIFASVLIERIFDGVWLMACFFFCVHLAKLPAVLLRGGYFLGAFIVLGGLMLAYGMYAKKQSLRLFFGLSWPRWFATLIDDLHAIGHSRYLYLSFLVSGAYMLAQILPLYALVRASSLNVPWTASFTMMVLLRLTSIVPQAPGNLGAFQWVSSQSLIMFGLAAPHAKRVAWILWAVITLPLIVIGCIALAITGVNLSHVHKEAAAAAKDGSK